MEQLLKNEYVFWIVTSIVGGLFGLIIALLRKRQEAQEKRIDKLEGNIDKNTGKINEILTGLPIQYTLRDEFLRVTTDQNHKLDKIGDTLKELSVNMAAIKTAVTGGMKCGDQ